MDVHLPLIARNLKWLMAKKQVNSNSLAALADARYGKGAIAQATIFRIADGQSKDPKTANLALIAPLLGVTVAQLREHDFELLGYPGDPTIQAVAGEAKLVKVRVVGEAMMGDGETYRITQFPENGDGYVVCAVTTPGAYALRAFGDSMRPTIMPEHYVVIEPNRKASLGNIVAIRTIDGDQYIKRWTVARPNLYEFSSVNEAYPNISRQPDQVPVIHRVSYIIQPDDFHPDVEN